MFQQSIEDYILGFWVIKTWFAYSQNEKNCNLAMPLLQLDLFF